MFDFTGTDTFETYKELVEEGPKEKPKRPISKQRKATLDSIAECINAWTCVSSHPTRNELVYRLSQHLNGNDFKTKISCIPSLLVQEKYPIEIVRYYNDRDIAELVGRMMWINDLYGCCIGILVGLENKETAQELEYMFSNIFTETESAFLVLM